MKKNIVIFCTVVCGILGITTATKAFIYFLPDYNGAILVTSGTGCEDSGYVYNRENCTYPRVLEDKCPSSNWYKKCRCLGSEDCTGQSEDYNPYGTDIGVTRTSCRDCGDNLLYSYQCGENGECDSYNLTDCPEHGYCSKCCDGFYRLESCTSEYEVAGDICVLKETCFGEETRESGADYSCSDCQTREGKRLYSCECVGNCYLDSCPLYGICNSDCKGKYCLTGCQEGYKLNSSETGCIDECDKLQEGCSTGYEFVNQCVRKSDGKTYGDCVDCKDEAAFNNPCKGYYTCSGGGRTPSGEAKCYCGNVPYYEKCLVQETCFSSGGSYYNTSLGRCSEWGGTGYYYVGEKCTNLVGKTFQLYCNCDYWQKDCMGNTPPCQGFKICDDLGGGAEGTESCTCGGRTYYKACAETCVAGGTNSCNYSYVSLTDKELAEKYNNEPPPGTYFVKDKCTKLDGTVIKWFLGCTARCLDANGENSPCGGMTYYDPETVPEAPDCECGGKTYYKETCIPVKNYGEGIYYVFGNGPEDVDKGWVFIERHCVTRQGKAVMSVKPCTATRQPCAGYKTCPKGTFVGEEDTCECGGVTYGKTCMAECNYEDTEESCTSDGKSFNKKCMDANKVWFGECV